MAGLDLAYEELLRSIIDDSVLKAATKTKFIQVQMILVKEKTLIGRFHVMSRIWCEKKWLTKSYYLC